MKSLVLENDPILQKRGTFFDFQNPQEDATKLKQELIEAMVKYDGLGLSACQIGIDLKVFAMRIDNNAICCFNPRITMYSEEETYIREGCLTYPGLFFPVRRSYGINCNWAGDDGELSQASFVQLPAKIFQHEYDHMIGKVYTEYVSSYILRNARRKQKLWNRKKRRHERIDY